jgi:hypothetical protein
VEINLNALKELHYKLRGNKATYKTLCTSITLVLDVMMEHVALRFYVLTAAITKMTAFQHTHVYRRVVSLKQTDISEATGDDT